MRPIQLIILVNYQFMQLVQSTLGFEGSGSPMEWLLHELNGAHLRLSASVESPWLTESRDSNGTVTYHGNIVDFADYMAQAFNATYSFVPMRSFETTELGTRASAVNLLRNNEVDIVTGTMSLHPFYCDPLDCSLSLYFEAAQLLVPWPKEESPILAPIRPFQNEVWIWLPISIFIVSVTLFFLQNYYNRIEDRNDIQNVSIGSRFWKLFVYLISGEGDWDGWRQLSVRLVQGAWCLAAFVLVNAYCSTLISFLVSPKLMPVAKTYDELASGTPQNLKLLAEKNELVALYSLQAKSGPFKVFGDLLRRYPESQFTNRERALEQLLSGEYAYIGAERRVAVFMAKAFKRLDQCKFTISNKIIDRTRPMVWTFRKKWRYTEAFNYKMRWLPEFGLPNYWLKRVMPRAPSCNVENKNGDDTRKILSLNDLSGPFILLLFGISLSLLAFLMEKVYYYYKLIRNSRTIVIV